MPLKKYANNCILNALALSLPWVTFTVAMPVYYNVLTTRMIVVFSAFLLILLNLTNLQTTNVIHVHSNRTCKSHVKIRSIMFSFLMLAICIPMIIDTIFRRITLPPSWKGNFVLGILMGCSLS